MFKGIFIHWNNIGKVNQHVNIDCIWGVVSQIFFFPFQSLLIFFCIFYFLGWTYLCNYGKKFKIHFHVFSMSSVPVFTLNAPSQVQKSKKSSLFWLCALTSCQCGQLSFSNIGMSHNPLITWALSSIGIWAEWKEQIKITSASFLPQTCSDSSHSCLPVSLSFSSRKKMLMDVDIKTTFWGLKRHME